MQNMDALLNENIGLVHPAIRQVIKWGEITDDFFQAGLMGLHEALGKYKPEFGELSTYAYSIIRNRVKDELRTQSRFRFISANPETMNNVPFKEEESNRDCDINLNVLNERERTIIELYYGFKGNELNFPQIAEVFGTTRQYVESVHKTAIQKLRKVIYSSAV